MLCPTAFQKALVTEPEESGETTEAIAISKALAWSRSLAAADQPSTVIASDGGLLIPALGEAWDPRLTRRFAGEGASNHDRATKLLALMAHISGLERTIGWQESIAIASEGALHTSWTAVGEPGVLADTIDDSALADTEGFWIPTIWSVPSLNFRLLSSLTPDERAGLQDHWNVLQRPVREFFSNSS